MNLTSFKSTFFGVMVVQQVMFRLISSRSGGATRRGAVRWMAQAFSTSSSTTLTTRSLPCRPTTLRTFHATVWARDTNAAVEEDLDSALENILGESFSSSSEAEKPATNRVAAGRQETSYLWVRMSEFGLD